MLPQLIKTNNGLSKTSFRDHSLSKEFQINYNKSSLHKENHVTSINVDRAVQGKGEFSNVKTYTQNTVKKFELSGNKELCVRKVMIAEREDHLFDVTVRELKVYYRKEKKHHFNKVIRFKTPIGSIEHVFNLLKNQGVQKNINAQTQYLLN
jgi:hypothetical protein